MEEGVGGGGNSWAGPKRKPRSPSLCKCLWPHTRRPNLASKCTRCEQVGGVNMGGQRDLEAFSNAVVKCTRCE
jgi:formate dehydrogenase maturation protein FdhE